MKNDSRQEFKEEVKGEFRKKQYSMAFGLGFWRVTILLKAFNVIDKHDEVEKGQRRNLRKRMGFALQVGAPELLELSCAVEAHERDEKIAKESK